MLTTINNRKQNEIEEAENDMFNASSEGNLDNIRKLIEHGIKSDFVNNATRYTPVMVAAISGHHKVVEYLLSNGSTTKNWTFPVVPYNDDYYSILDYLVIKDNLVCLKQFLKYGRKVVHPPLYIAIEFSRINIVEWIIKEYPESVNNKDQRGRFPLEAAVINWHTNLTKLLLENGANPNILPYYSFSLFHQAIFDGRGDIVDLMIQHNVDLTFRPNELLLFAIKSCDEKTVEVLLNNGVSISLEHIRIVLEKKKFNMAHLLLQYNPGIFLGELSLHHLLSNPSKSYQGI
mmetsp:Transcript_3508/g.5153  ORF Transcript_3508/g.5153 Transcript_3508/m.5153 type:complete len:289 (-) Transcript_3508:16-882(-)